MAKTKKVAGVKKQLVTAKAKADSHAEPPPKRVRGKQNACEKPVEDVPPPVGPPECDITWENFEIIQKHYGLSEMDTTSVLLSVVGPDTKGSKFWNTYKARVKLEQSEPGSAKRAKLEKFIKKPEVPTEPNPTMSPPPRKELFCPEPVDNQLGDPTLYPEDEIPTEDDCEGEGEGEEEGDPVEDPELNDTDLADDEGVGVPATGGGGGDDQDSPQAGAATVTEDTQEYAVEPTEAVEPVLESFPKDDPARDAREELERSLKRKPTPARQGRHVVYAERVESPTPPAPELVRNRSGEYKSLLSCSTLQLGQQHLSRQASTVNLGATGSRESDVDTELGPSASEAHAHNAEQLEEFVKSLSHVQHVLADPSMRSVVGALAPHLLQLLPEPGNPKAPGNLKEPADDLAKAKEGLPSSSRAGQVIASLGCPVPKGGPVIRRSSEAAPAPPAKLTKTGPAVAASTPAVKAEPADAPPAPRPDTPPVDAEVNSSTHRAAHARLARRMEKLDPAQFPNVAKLWSGGRKEKQELLKQFVANGENLKRMETTLHITREQSGEMTQTKELLTIPQMRARGFSQTKIDSIISKQTPHPDPDAPEDPESVRFWATCGGSLSQKERSTISAAAAAKIQSNCEGLAAMVGAVDLESGENGTKVGNGPTLKALVDVANTAEPTPACKAKPKAKAKAKAIAQQSPKTPAEHRKALGAQLKKELSQCVSVIADLPQSNSLRAPLLEQKNTLEEKLGEVKDIPEDDLEDFASTCTDVVRNARLIRAQAKAVAMELKKEEAS